LGRTGRAGAPARLPENGGGGGGCEPPWRQRQAGVAALAPPAARLCGSDAGCDGGGAVGASPITAAEGAGVCPGGDRRFASRRRGKQPRGNAPARSVGLTHSRRQSGGGGTQLHSIQRQNPPDMYNTTGPTPGYGGYEWAPGLHHAPHAGRPARLVEHALDEEHLQPGDCHHREALHK
jgi:hypothetical protein